MSVSNTMPAKDTGAQMPLAPERVCYEAHWRDQSVYICAPCQSVREWQWHCLASAILLERLEDACVLAETMLESSLQFFVSELPEVDNVQDKREKDYLRVQLTRAADQVDIWLPACAHNTVMRHGELVEASNLCWSSVSAAIRIAHIELAQHDIDRLHKGALVLIPASWQKQWSCTIDVQQLDQHICATLDPDTGTIKLDHTSPLVQTPDNEPANKSTFTAYLDQTIDIDPGSLLNVESDNDRQGTHTLNVSLEQARCRCRLNQHHFVADLIRIGEGFGLCVQEFS